MSTKICLSWSLFTCQINSSLTPAEDLQNEKLQFRRVWKRGEICVKRNARFVILRACLVEPWQVLVGLQFYVFHSLGQERWVTLDWYTEIPSKKKENWNWFRFILLPFVNSFIITEKNIWFQGWYSRHSPECSVWSRDWSSLFFGFPERSWRCIWKVKVNESQTLVARGH